MIAHPTNVWGKNEYKIIVILSEGLRFILLWLAFRFLPMLHFHFVWDPLPCNLHDCGNFHFYFFVALLQPVLPGMQNWLFYANLHLFLQFLHFYKGKLSFKNNAFTLTWLHHKTTLGRIELLNSSELNNTHVCVCNKHIIMKLWVSILLLFTDWCPAIILSWPSAYNHRLSSVHQTIGVNTIVCWVFMFLQNCEANWKQISRPTNIFLPEAGFNQKKTFWFMKLFTCLNKLADFVLPIFVILLYCRVFNVYL